ncbi:uncharacterized protein LOC119094621 [Pollicipes pollicipes]|uniref:uncharacterized protein LOC119094621 n=1 Tax=Pollicipes pollicipes TaxID=41117 RepID=UPI001884BAB6|nr:uncharacterized protein LOC119094621 [Pollicipes pollicipes]
MASWSQTALASALLLLAVGHLSRAQYQTGYGTGPQDADLFPRDVPEDDEDLAAARAASIIAIRLFRTSDYDSNFIQDVTPFYKYRRPMFVTSFEPFGGILGLESF